MPRIKKGQLRKRRVRGQPPIMCSKCCQMVISKRWLDHTCNKPPASLTCKVASCKTKLRSERELRLHLRRYHRNDCSAFDLLPAAAKICSCGYSSQNQARMYDHKCPNRASIACGVESFVNGRLVTCNKKYANRSNLLRHWNTQKFPHKLSQIQKRYPGVRALSARKKKPVRGRRKFSISIKRRAIKAQSSSSNEKKPRLPKINAQLLRVWTTKEVKIKDRRSQWSIFGDDSRLKYRLPGAGNKLHPIIKSHSKLLVSLAKKLTIFDGTSYRDIAHHFDATLSDMNIFWTLHDDEDIDEESKYRAVKRFFTTRSETKPDRWRKRAASGITKYTQEHIDRVVAQQQGDLSRLCFAHGIVNYQQLLNFDEFSVMGNMGSLGHKNRLLKPVGGGRKHALVGKHNRDCTTVITFVRGDGEIHFTVVLKKGYKPEEGNVVTHISRYVSTVTAAGTFISGHKGSDLLIKVLQAKLPLLGANSPECFIGDEAGSHDDPILKAFVNATNRIYLMGGGGHTGASQVVDSTLIHLKLRRYLLRMSKNLKFIAFRKAELNGTLSKFKPPSITAKDLIPWLEIFAKSPQSQISVCLAFKRRCWLQGTSDERRDEIKQMITRYSLRLAENPRATLPQNVDPRIAYHQERRPYKHPQKAAICELCGCIRSSKATLQVHRCPLELELPLLPCLPSVLGPFCTKEPCYKNRKCLIYTTRFTSSGAWEPAVVLTEVCQRTISSKERLRIQFPEQSNRKRIFTGNWRSLTDKQFRWCL